MNGQPRVRRDQDRGADWECRGSRAGEQAGNARMTGGAFTFQ